MRETIGEICKSVRVKNFLTIKDISKDDKQLKTLWAFENNKSSNMYHIGIYLNIVSEFGTKEEVAIFNGQILRALKNGK